MEYRSYFMFCFPVKSVGSKDKIGYGEKKLTEICDAAKGETWRSVEYRQCKILKIVTDMSVSFKWQSFCQTSRI